VALVYDHSDSFGDRLGYATSFRDTDAGLHATFRLDPSRADHARDVLTSSHGGLSVGFYSIIPKIGSEAAGALVTRRSAALVHVACVAQPAHPGARVETIRAALDFGEPTAADIALAEQRRADAELLAFFAAEAGRWNTLQH
jgi:phage head maturation protease